MKFQELRIRRDPECPICGDNPSISKLIDYDQFCGLPAKVDVEAELEPSKLEAMMQDDSPCVLVDVREPGEYEISRIPGSVLIPLGELPSRLAELNPEATIIVHCHSGSRSAKACAILKEAGFKNAVNLHGGIMEWMKLDDRR